MTPARARNLSEVPLERIAFLAAAGSTVAILFSIAASQILLGLAVAALLLSRRRPLLPAAWPPLAAFLGLTVVSLLASGNITAGLPQIRKFFVYLTLVTVFTTVRRVDRAVALVQCWAAAASLGAVVAIVQFLVKLHAAHRAGRPVYEFYLAQRVTGFMSHWQTFGGEQMIALLLLLAFLVFSPRAAGRVRWLAIAGAAMLSTALVLDYSRGIWLGLICGLCYLLWKWRRPAVLAVPVFAALLLWLNPAGAGRRLESILFPSGTLDSNDFRIVCWRTGLRMIEAHPVLGLGPEIVHRRFMDYVPADIPRPLPEGWYGHLHNVYVHYAAERGILAAVALILFLLRILFDMRRALARAAPFRSDARFLIEGTIAVLIAIMASGVFELNLGDSEVLTLFLATVALGYVAAGEVPDGR